MRKFSPKCIREGFDLGILFGFAGFMIDFLQISQLAKLRHKDVIIT